MEEDKDLRDLLGAAVKSEQEAQEIYEELKKRTGDETLSELLDDFKNQEVGHEEDIRDLFEDFFPDMELSLPESSGVEEPEADISELEGVEDLIEVAMSAEKDAENFYRKMKKEFEDDSIRRMFSYMAYTEREHYEKLKELREGCEG